MRKSFLSFLNNSIKNFGEAVINFFIFLPYFFSVATLTKTLFFPWRNLVVKKTTKGFSLGDWGNRFAFNLISRGIGFLMRLSIITFYFIFQALFMIVLPFAALLYFLLIPLAYVNYLFQQTEEERKENFKSIFIKNHLLKEENRTEVERWFEQYYLRHLKKTQWWHLNNLLSTPPLARDWAVGYTPTLDKYVTDLATGSYLHHLKNIVGRDREISEIELILSKNIEANVMIVGEEGVGKHTIVDALAKKIYLGKTNVLLIYKRILKLNMEKVLNESTDQKQRESFFEELLEEASKAKNVILFIDDIDKYISEESGIDLTTSIAKYGKTGHLQIIGITNPFAYEKFIVNNDKINRLFNKIDVFEVTKKEAIEILLESAFNFEDYHHMVVPYETIIETVDKSEFYLTYIPFPEKAVDLLDNACAFAKTQGSKVVSPENVDHVLTEKTHVPVTITSQMKEKLINLETILYKKIVEQKEAVNELSSSLRRSFLLIGKRKKPLASFLFLGPTGVGKTETAKAVADEFFGTSEEQKNLIRFDMSLYQSKSDIPKLIGDNRYAEPGLLSSAIRENPYGVLLLDEIEKADRDLLNIFLTVIDEGYFTDGAGKRVDCKNLIVIATSNAASDFIYKNNSMGNQKIIDYLVENRIFSPEFLNRFDGVIAYKPLSEKSLKIIANKMLQTIASDIKSLYKINIEVSEQTLSDLVKKGYDPRFGARNLERVIRDNIEDKISKIILKGKVNEKEIIRL